jgi:hypothetical protein
MPEKSGIEWLCVAPPADPAVGGACPKAGAAAASANVANKRKCRCAFMVYLK